jgi:hypothetical protein
MVELHHISSEALAFGGSLPGRSNPVSLPILGFRDALGIENEPISDQLSGKLESRCRERDDRGRVGSCALDGLCGQNIKA